MINLANQIINGTKLSDKLIIKLAYDLAEMVVAESDVKTISPNDERYRHLRTLNPRQFSELFRRNLMGEGNFDDLVDQSIKASKGKVMDDCVQCGSPMGFCECEYADSPTGEPVPTKEQAMQSEIDVLKAHVERFKTKLDMHLINSMPTKQGRQYVYDMICSETPAQSLAIHDAEIRKAERERCAVLLSCVTNRAIDQYACARILRDQDDE